MAEITTVDAWLYATLSADMALTALVGTRIYLDMAPEGISSRLWCTSCKHQSAIW